jgi:hypothetical protein
LEAKLNVRVVRTNPEFLTKHHIALAKGVIIQFDFTRVELRARTFGRGTKWLTLDNDKLGRTPKRIVFNMIEKSAL